MAGWRHSEGAPEADFARLEVPQDSGRHTAISDFMSCSYTLPITTLAGPHPPPSLLIIGSAQGITGYVTYLHCRAIDDMLHGSYLNQGEQAMMPVVRINDATFADLSTLKTWFGTKTPSETIDRLVREAMEQLGMERSEEPDDVVPAPSDGPMQFDTAPGLTFTKPIVVSINGKSLHNPTWSSILVSLIAQVKAKGLLEGKKLSDELAIRSKAEKYEDEGFKYYPELGISVQGQSAADAWKEVDRLAKKWRIPVMVEFWWRQNPKAQYPGKTGVLRSGKA